MTFGKATWVPPEPGEGWSRSIAEVANAIVVPPTTASFRQKTGVFDQDMEYLPLGATWRYSNRMTLRPDHVDPPKETHPGRWLWGGVLFNHFGHFLVESTSRLWALDQCARHLSGIVFVNKRPRAPRTIAGYRRDFIDLLAGDIPIHVVKGNQQFESLIVPGQGLGLGSISRGTPEAHAFYKTRLAASVSGEGPNLLYVSRAKLPLETAGILGEQSLERLLEGQGYSIFYPEEHPIDVQIARYMAAEKIIVADGSAAHLLAMVSPATQKVAYLNRRTYWNEEPVSQIEGFKGRPITVIDALTREWLPNEPQKFKHVSFGELNYSEISKILSENGFLSNPAQWSNATRSSAEKQLEEAGLLSHFSAREIAHGNPQLIPVIKETHRLNGVETIDVRTALVTRDGGTDCSFYVRKGFQPDVNTSETSSIRVYQAAPKMNQPDTENLMPARSYKPWPIVNPRVFVATCMKDEGPFILEWIAWHRAIGVTNFVVYTNDCSDGTVELLDKLQDMGEVRHLPNPAVALGKTNFQPVALDYTHYLKEFREADYFVSIDVDEFINVRVGTGRLADLFKEVGPFDAISVSEINHGCNNRVEFERGWVTDQFPRHDTESPGRKRAQRGVKTITRLSPRVHKIRNHRPDFVPGLTDLAWFNGSGVRFQDLAQAPKANGVDSRGTYGIVSLEHYSIRSLHSYLMKMVRGDVVVADKSVSQRYWRQRNRNAHTSSVFNPTIVEAARTYYQTTFGCVEELMDLHGACCMHHETRSKEILQQQEVSERLNWITENAWDTALEEELENSKRTSNKKNAP